MSTPQTTSQFVNSLGVNVHVEYTDGKYASASNVIADLAYLGETHVRDAVLNPSNQGQGSYDALAAAGIKFDLFLQGSTLPSTLALVDAFVQRHPGAVSLIEGPNEVNNFPISYGGQSGNAAATAYQNALFAAVKGDGSLAGVPVADLTSWPFLGGSSDYANYHFYPNGGAQPAGAYGSSLSDLATQDPGKPMVMTEGGYNTLLSDNYFGGVDEATQAKLTLNLYCDNAKLGIVTTYLYQLLDPYADLTNSDSDKHFGLFHLDNTPKLAATAIHNLTTLLLGGADAAAPATNLTYSVAGLPQLGSVLALTKTASIHDLLIWNEPTIWNGSTHSAVQASATNVTVHLAAAAKVVVFDPLVSTGAVASYASAQDVVVAVTDHPLVIEVTDLAPAAIPAPSINHAPVLSGAAASTTNDGVAATPFAAMSIVDPDAGQAETVTVTYASTDGILSGAAFQRIAPGVYQATAASAAAAQTALRALSFTPTVQPSGTPATTTVFSVAISDGQASTTDGASTITALHATNTPVTLLGLGSTQATTDKLSLSAFAGVTVADPDLDQVETVTVSLSNPAAGALSGGGFATVAGSPGMYRVAAGSAASAQAALRAAVFTPTADLAAAGSTSSQTLTVTIDDGVSHTTASSALSVMSVNDAPILAGLHGVASAPSGGSVTLQSELTIADPDAGAQVVSARVSLAGFVAGDLLSLPSPPAGVTSTYDPQAGVLILTGASSDAAYAQALRSVSFGHAGAVDAGSRTAMISVTDDGGATTTASQTISVAAYNPPAATVPSVPTSTPATTSSPVSTAAGSPATTASSAGDAVTASTTTASVQTAGVSAATSAAAVHDTSTMVAAATAATATSSAVTALPAVSTALGATSASPSLSVQSQNLIRAGVGDAALSDVSSPIHAAAVAAAAISAQLDAGVLTPAAASTALNHLVDGTTSVAQLSYAFFTGQTPTAAGLNYLVHSDANAADLNDPYYAQFSTMNRYINMSVALAKDGAGTGAYHAAYDPLSLSQATAKAYAAIFDTTASNDKVSALLNTAVPDGRGGTETRAEYFAAYGADGMNGSGTKAAMIGWLLGESVVEGTGGYQAAEAHFLQDLAHGSARFGVDLLAVYGSTPNLVGQSAPDVTLGL